MRQQAFVGSLWTVGGLPSPSQFVPCGNQPVTAYTYIGPAVAFQPVSRIYANLRPHQALSLSFNVFVVDANY